MILFLYKIIYVKNFGTIYHYTYYTTLDNKKVKHKFEYSSSQNFCQYMICYEKAHTHIHKLNLDIYNLRILNTNPLRIVDITSESNI